MHTRLIIAVILLIATRSIVLAESRLGRLPDGRAYRVADDGVEMVDHLAELELTVEELKTRMHGLEYELEEKTNIISALKNSGAKEPEFKETDLLAGQPQISEAATSAITKSNASQDALLHSQLTDLQSAFLAEQQKNEQLMLALQKARRDADLIQAQRDQLANDLQRASTVEITAADDQEQAELTKLKISYEKLEQQYDQALREMNELQNQYKYKERELEEYKAIAESRQSTDGRASLRPEAPVRAGDLKTDLKTQLNRIKGMINERDRRYRLYKLSTENSKRTVRMSAVRTSNGLTLTDVSNQIDLVTSQSDMNKVRSYLDELRALVERDISMLGRLAN